MYEGIEESSELNSGKKFIVPILLIIFVIIFALAFFFIYTQTKVTCPDGTRASSLSDCPCPDGCCIGETKYSLKECADNFVCIDGTCKDPTAQFEKGDCPYACCLSSDSFYSSKDCATGLQCSSNQCITPLKDCTTSCCQADDPVFKAKACSTGFTCKDNNCVSNNVLQACTFECCSANDKNYLRKDCSIGKYCVAHKCVRSSSGSGGGGSTPYCGDNSCNAGETYSTCLTDCPLKECNAECCSSSLGFVQKDCDAGKECVEGFCNYIKQECPNECCSNEPQYFDKTCSSFIGYNKTCEADNTCIVDCSNDLFCLKAMLASCFKAKGVVENVSENYSVRVSGLNDDLQCSYNSEVVSSINTSLIGKSVFCTIDYLAVSLDVEAIKNISSGSVPSQYNNYIYCSGSLLEGS